ncbi:MAG TPA: hypothetical protein VK762_34165 [Polyangiaceae bacterium]|jgi:hypothetical protein|nr:hypothetical protein [Polyangiaceae bacterium]
MTPSRAMASLAWVVAATWLVPLPASADPAAAEALFREGRRLLDEGRTEEACLKLKESQAQDPSSGTLLNLGLCHEMQHKVATAWSDYVSAARLAREQGRADRAAVAEKKVAELEPRLPYLTVTAASPVEGLEITRGDDRLGAGVLGSAVPLDPGSYVVIASAPRYRTWQTTVDVAEAESKAVQVPALEPLTASAPPEEPPPAPTAVAPAALPEASATGQQPAAGAGVLGWIIGGVGLAGLGVGVGFGVSSLAKYHDASSLCPSHEGCSADAMSARSAAESRAWISNIGIGAGVAGAAIGGWIVIRGRRASTATRVAVGSAPGASGMSLSLSQGF